MNSKPIYNGPKVRDIETLIMKARWVHGNKYDYSESVYINSRTNIKINCPEHGPFYQQPDSHTGGRGCPQCGRVSRGIKQRTPKREVIERAIKVHGNNYDYSLLEDMVLLSGKSTIICKEHGEFEQNIDSHLNGARCTKCSGLHKKTNEDIIKQFKEVHQNRYIYDEIEFQSVHEKINIRCTEHGVFSQTPHNHRRGHGCPKCAALNKSSTFLMSHGEYDCKARLYVFEIFGNNENFVKVGLTTRSPHNRMRDILMSSNRTYKCELLSFYEEDLVDIYKMEQLIHNNESLEKYVPKEIFGGWTECYSIDQKDRILALLDEQSK